MSDPTTDAAREGFTEAEIVANHGNPTWEAIWGVIKKWDISRDGFTRYSGATGDDVQRIFLAVAAVSRARDEYHAKRLRQAVEAVRDEHCGPRTATLSMPIHVALDALLRAMEDR